MNGRIARIVRDRGFGFIKSEDSTEEYFFHYSAIQREPGFSWEELEEGQEVEFEEGSGPKGIRAENITRA